MLTLPASLPCLPAPQALLVELRTMLPYQALHTEVFGSQVVARLVDGKWLNEEAIMSFVYK